MVIEDNDDPITETERAICQEDISEAAKQAFMKSEMLFQKLADTSPIGIFILYKNTYCYVNRRFAEMSGYNKEELIGIDSSSFVHPDDRDEVRESITRLLKSETGELQPYEYRFVSRSGDQRQVMETVVPIDYQGLKATLGNFFIKSKIICSCCHCFNMAFSIKSLFSLCLG